MEESIKNALKEDIQYGDMTTEAIVLENRIVKVDIIAKESGIIAGTDVFKRVFKILGDVEVKFSVKEGEEVLRDSALESFLEMLKNSYGRKSCLKLYAKNVWNSKFNKKFCRFVDRIKGGLRPFF